MYAPPVGGKRRDTEDAWGLDMRGAGEDVVEGSGGGEEFVGGGGG